MYRLALSILTWPVTLIPPVRGLFEGLASEPGSE